MKNYHPRGLWYLAASYSLLMFSYITINTLLVLYATQRLGFTTRHAYALFAAFNSLIFTLPLPGGYLSSKFGYKYAAVVGAIVSLLGLVFISFSYQMTYYIGLSTFVIGYGLCTPAYFCLVGLSYAKDDKRRDGGYTNFYLLFNIGALAATFCAGYIADFINYSTAFLVAAAGLLISLVIFALGSNTLRSHSGRSVDPQLSWRRSYIVLGLFGISLFAIPAIFLLIDHPLANDVLILLLVFGALIGTAWLAVRQKTRLKKLKLLAFISLTSIAIIFWTLYMLESSLLIIYTEQNVNRQIFGTLVPPSVFYALDPIGIIIFGVLFSKLWRFLSKHKREVTLPRKFSASIVSVGIGYLIFALGTWIAVGHLVNPIWLLLGYVFLSCAELLLAPIGLSMVGRLSPPGNEGVLMGVWNLFIGLSAVVSSFAANFTTVTSHATLFVKNLQYVHFFSILGVVAVALGLISFLLSSKIQLLIRAR